MSPCASPSLFSWPGFGSRSQLSVASGTLSLSSSESQTSPCASPSLSAWSGFWSKSQLSVASGTLSLSSSESQTSPSASPSWFSWLGFWSRSQLSVASGTLSLSSSESQTSPCASPSLSAWPTFAICGQLSSSSPRPSESASPSSKAPTSEPSSALAVGKSNGRGRPRWSAVRDGGGEPWSTAALAVGSAIVSVGPPLSARASRSGSVLGWSLVVPKPQLVPESMLNPPEMSGALATQLGRVPSGSATIELVTTREPDTTRRLAAPLAEEPLFVL